MKEKNLSDAQLLVHKQKKKLQPLYLEEFKRIWKMGNRWWLLKCPSRGRPSIRTSTCLIRMPVTESSWLPMKACRKKQEVVEGVPRVSPTWEIQSEFSDPGLGLAVTGVWKSGWNLCLSLPYKQVKVKINQTYWWKLKILKRWDSWVGNFKSTLNITEEIIWWVEDKLWRLCNREMMRG